MNRGIIEMSFEMMNPQNYNLLKEAFRDIVVVHSKADYLRNTIEYICLSQLFEPTEQSDPVPMYEIKLSKAKGGKIKRTGVKKLGFKRWSIVGPEGETIAESGGAVNRKAAEEHRKKVIKGEQSNLKIER